MMIGRCAFEAFKVTNSVCGALSIILAISAMMFDIGFCHHCRLSDMACQPVCILQGCGKVL